MAGSLAAGLLLYIAMLGPLLSPSSYVRMADALMAKQGAWEAVADAWRTWYAAHGVQNHIASLWRQAWNVPWNVPCYGLSITMEHQHAVHILSQLHTHIIPSSLVVKLLFVVCTVICSVPRSLR